MEEKYTLNIILAVVVGLGCLASLLCQTFLPAAVLPPLDLPLLVGLSLIALIVEYYLPGDRARRQWPVTVVLAGLTFGLLPFCAGIVPAGKIPGLALLGAAVFTAMALLFTSICERLASGPAGPLAPALSGGVLYLACQSLAAQQAILLKSSFIWDPQKIAGIPYF